MRRYRGLVVFGGFTPVDPGEVEALERELGRPLPEDYLSFLHVANGGTLQYATRVPPGPEGEVVSYSDLYTLGRDRTGEYGWGTLVGEYRRLRGGWLAEEIGLEGWLPIARTGGEDDTLFLDLRPDTYGRVIGYLSGIPWHGYHHDNIIAPLADSFDAYLQSMFIDHDIAEMLWSDVADADPADPMRTAVEAWLRQGDPDPSA